MAYTNNDGYVIIYVKKEGKWQQWREHRYIWTQANGAIPKGMQIHHINGKRNDNRLENLQLVTQKQNHEKIDCAGKGFTIKKNRKSRPYVSQRWLNGKQRYLGYFGTKCGAYMTSRMAHINNNIGRI
jgi:hypothetical protein